MIPFAQEVQLETTSFQNSRGQSLFGLLAAPVQASSVGCVLLPPGYERRAHHYSVFSRYFVRHRYDTVRFDLANHIGLSDGEILRFTMSSMTQDIASVIADCIAEDRESLSIVASSLGARAVVRALAESPALQRGVDGVVLILPVIDTEHTTSQAIGRNVVEDWRSGLVADASQPCKVLNHIVSYDFARDALEHGFAGAERTHRELGLIACPVIALAAERDDWVEVQDVEAAMAVDAPGRRETVVLEAASHELSSNAPIVRTLMEEVLRALASFAGVEPRTPQHLEFDEIIDTVTHERQLKVDGYRSLLTAGATP